MACFIVPGNRGCCNNNSNKGDGEERKEAA